MSIGGDCRLQLHRASVPLTDRRAKSLPGIMDRAFLAVTSRTAALICERAQCGFRGNPTVITIATDLSLGRGAVRLVFVFTIRSKQHSGAAHAWSNFDSPSVPQGRFAGRIGRGLVPVLVHQRE